MTTPTNMCACQEQWYPVPVCDGQVASYGYVLLVDPSCAYHVQAQEQVKELRDDGLD